MGHLAGWKNCLGTEKVDSKSQKLLRTNDKNSQPYLGQDILMPRCYQLRYIHGRYTVDIR